MIEPMEKNQQLTLWREKPEEKRQMHVIFMEVADIPDKGPYGGCSS